jgi:hypothetical protein
MGKGPEGVTRVMLYRSSRQQVVEAVQVEESTDVPTSTGTMHAEPGDWLILDAEGNLSRCDSINFMCTYELTGDTSQYARVPEGKPCGC